jgi:hypothetical protein
MSLIESAPQKQKTYDGRKQDHGDAAQQNGIDRGPRFEGSRARSGLERQADQLLKDALSDTELDYSLLTPDQLDTETDEFPKEYHTVSERHDHPEEDEDDEPTPYQDFFPSEAELGVKSKHEIQREMGRRVTLDVAYEDDDNGDSDYHVPVRIKNRL